MYIHIYIYLVYIWYILAKSYEGIGFARFQIYPPYLTQVPSDGYIYLEDAYILEIVRI
jgi:hypothetical protein